ncbi:MAG TPA: adenylosuccinate synthase [Candidatus Saccharimonadales bacterium]|nr:adenylosuccinate synthase [Candidatus Saccharimonadales bacterium]
MPVTFVVGSQWGDEGKGRMVDYLSGSYDYVVRFNGSNNAGHTVINGFGKFALHLIPSGIFYPKTKSCIANGTLVDLESLISEIDSLEKAGFNLNKRLLISPRCHLIMPYHKILEKLYEEALGKAKIGTTGRGNGPAYADKISRNGLRIIDLLNKKQFSEKLKIELSLKNKIIVALGGKAIDQKTIEKSFLSMLDKILPYISEPFPQLQSALKLDKNILLEGAQAIFLDNDWGTYPFVTSSTVVPGGANAGSGIPPTKIDKIIGVVKAYATRVGSGPFPTELQDKDGVKLQKDGAEFGVTTGRTRRCGWFDAEMVSFAAQISGFTEIALTKIDVLDGFAEIKICTGYTLNGKKVNYYDGDAIFLENVKPAYKTIKGWKSSTQGITNYQDLPTQAKQYIIELEKQIGVRIKYISTGPAREAIIVR